MLIETNYLCSMTKSNLYESMEKKDWKNTERLLLLNSTKKMVRRNPYTLFIATNFGPKHIIQQIYNICTQQVLFKDVYGNNPLHNCLINYGLDDENVVSFLLEVAPELAEMRNDDGMLPLHKALMSRRSPKIIKLLLQSYPKGLDDDISIFGSPAQVFFDEWLDELEDHVDNFEILRYSPYKGPEGNDFDIVYRTLLYIIGTAMKNHSSKSSSFEEKDVVLPIHTALKLENIQFPPVFTNFMIKTLRDEINKTDKNGNYPLHIVANRKDINSELIESLIEVNPEILICPNNQGRTPLAIAVTNRQEKEIILALFQGSIRALCSKMKLSI